MENETSQQRVSRLRNMAPLDRPRHLRPYKRQDGQELMITCIECCCEGRRGPVGGVCGNCSGAIPETKGDANG